MASLIRLVFVVLVVGFLLVGPEVLQGQETQETQETCDGPYKGKHLSSKELADVLALHGKWVETHPVYSMVLGGEPSGQRANLCEAELKEAHLPGAALQGANLQGARLQEANLQGAQLEGANLQEANLWKANLQEANLGSELLIGTEVAGVPVWPLWEANVLSVLPTHPGANLIRIKLSCLV